MFNTDDYNVPFMSDEGIEKIILYFKNRYKQGKWCLDSQEYLSSKIILSTDKEPLIFDKKDYNNSKEKYEIEIFFLLLEAMKEDIKKYGIIEYINKLKLYFHDDNIYNYSNIKVALNCSEGTIKQCILNKELDRLPKLFKHIYEKCAMIDDYAGHMSAIPYVPIKDVYNPEFRGGGRKSFRIYLNTPVGEDGLKFYYLFVSELIKNRIPYDNKYCYNIKESSRKDKSIFYFPIDYLNEITSILKEISIQNPELINTFGTPPTSCAQNSYYGLSFSQLAIQGCRTFNMYFNDATQIAFAIYFSKNLLMFGAIFSKLNEKEKTIIRELSQATYSSEFCEKISTVSNPIPKEFNSIVNKVGTLVNIPVDLNIYRNILKKVVSLRVYGDLEHTDSLIAFNENFYEIDKENKKANSINEEKRNMNLETEESVMYLYHIEELFDSALQEYLHSNLPEYKKTKQYIERINFIQQQFRHYARTTKGFVGSERYKTVISIISNLLYYESYHYDVSISEAENKIKEIEYYTNIANELNLKQDKKTK